MKSTPRELLPSYNFVNSELEILASGLADIAINTNQKITLEQAQQVHLQLNIILRHFILAARAAGHATSVELPPSTPHLLQVSHEHSEFTTLTICYY